MDGSTLTRCVARTARPSASVGAAGRHIAAGVGVGVAVVFGASARTSVPLANGRLHTLLAAAPLLAAGASMGSVALQNRRLRAETARTADALHRSRARIAATADRERRRIERDLHDGAQQRLVAVRIELGLLEDLVHEDAGPALDRIRALEGTVEAALEDLRSLAHGVCPPLLADRGLPDALRAVAVRSPVRVDVQAAGVGRYAPEVESAVYFCVLEALQNVAKHASDARHVEIHLNGGTRAMRFAVRDDGPGANGDAPREGAGMTNMRDRIAAVGGGLTIISRPGSGTTVRGEVPLARLSTLL